MLPEGAGGTREALIKSGKNQAEIKVFRFVAK